MKKISISIIVILITIVVFGRYPQFHTYYNVRAINIIVFDYNEYDKWPNPKYITKISGEDEKCYSRTIDDSVQVANLLSLLKVRWEGVLPLNYNARSDYAYRLEIIDKNRDKKIVEFTSREMGRAGKPNKELVREIDGYLR
jgi:hypothetical protein